MIREHRASADDDAARRPSRWRSRRARREGESRWYDWFWLDAIDLVGWVLRGVWLAVRAVGRAWTDW